jgi:hypothetical protein
VWLYSFNPEQGCRLITQLSVEGYRLACSQSISIAPELQGIKPWDLLSAVLNEYDTIESLAGRAKVHDKLSNALAIYASQTQTWARLPPIGQVPGLHFVVADWTTKSGLRIFRPVVSMGRDVLTPEDVVSAYDTVLHMHVAKNPSEAPRSNI